MSWPSNDFELAIQNELDALHKVVRAVITMRQKFGDEYEGRFEALDDAMSAWAAIHIADPFVALTPEEEAYTREVAMRLALHDVPASKESGPR